MTARELLERGRRRLEGLPDTDPALDARVLLRRAAGFTELELLAYPDRPVAAASARRYLRMIEARRDRVPVAYIIGEKEFWSIPMLVAPAVLIPRPETELIVEKTLASAASSEPVIIEIGTGSGCLAVALAKELPGARILATDISRRALRVAAANAARHGTPNVEFIQGDLCGALRGRNLEGRADFLISNPPYVAAAEWTLLAPEVRDHEPRRALVPGPSGLEAIRRLIKGGHRYLKTGGMLLLEFGDGQADQALRLLDGRWKRPEIILDLSGRPRVLAATA